MINPTNYSNRYRLTDRWAGSVSGIAPPQYRTLDFRLIRLKPL